MAMLKHWVRQFSVLTEKEPCRSGAEIDSLRLDPDSRFGR
jgi:hypothetical protein